jgi:hypothetical protein
MKQWFFHCCSLIACMIWSFIYLFFFSITWVLLGRRVIGGADMVTAWIELRSAGMVVNNCSRCTDVLMVTCYSVCFVVAVGVLLVSDKIKQWNIIKCLLNLEILSSDICSVLEGVCEKESWHKQVFMWLSDFEVQSKVLHVMSQPPSFKNQPECEKCDQSGEKLFLILMFRRWNNWR